ncbi:D-3-phosphoglycerate dehydrogenase 2 [Purpureocillium lavendulum]|uniref:D-3-phosphoglycerate dehydrogenase 2 n=1 Tax=Purpureocillium lavendulum TaxID=1247861 RepID=A0AB34FH67_9HYPO|nr:D-3-phosphoglycerate dehydrogenase 2 [Purpureocillium lavendulum]
MRTQLIFVTLAGVVLAAPPADNCPPAGMTDSRGRYSCNPAHPYPNGQTCDVIDGCYYLSAGGKPVTNTVASFTVPVTSAKPTASATCPAPGSTDNQGRYSCNPAHQYPNSQTCKAIDGCYYLCDANGNPIKNKPTGQPTKSSPSGTPANSTRTGMPVVTAGAAKVHGAGILVLAAAGLML